MNLGTGYFKKFFNKLNTMDLILNSILSFCISVFLFYVFFPNPGYSSLKDFFVGETIYADYNKYFDIFFVFLYIAVFFLFSFVYGKIKNLVFKPKIKAGNLTSKIVYALQYISLVCYFLLYPSDGNFYPVLLGVIILLIVAGVIEIRKKQRISQNDGLVHFSYIAVTALVLLCFGRIYSFQQIFIDPHHDAEHITAFFMHTKYNMQYYKDIMLVHGYRDTIESWLGLFVFGNENLYTYFLGKTLYYNLLVVIFGLFSLFVFRGNPAALITFASLYRNDDLTLLFGIYILTFYAIVQKKIFDNKQLFLSLYVFLSFVFIQYWTTMGILWAISVLPAVVYSLIEIIKKKQFKQLTIPAVTLAVCTAICAKDLYYFCQQAAFYTKGNLFGFGTVMPPLNLQKFELYYRMSAIIALPALMIIAAKEISKKTEKNTEYLFLLAFTIILIFVSLNYTMGRIDADSFTRLLNISVNLIFIIIPYIAYRFYNKNQLLMNYVLTALIFVLIYTGLNKIVELKTMPRLPKQQIERLEKQGLLDLRNDEKSSLTDMTEFIKRNFQKGDIFLDLTNEGLLYYLLDKKIPIPYTSYYNIVSDKQAAFALKKIKNNEPDVIYMDNLSRKLDDSFPSLRINPIYRHLLLSKKYKLVTDENKNKALLVNTGTNNNRFNYSELQTLDKMLATNNIEKLPDAWGKSIKTLPVEEFNPQFVLSGFKMDSATVINIHFNTPVNGKDLELLYISAPGSGETNWVMQPNNTASMLFFQSKTGKMLVPLDNFPSWMLNDSVTDITVKTNANINQNTTIKFYKRKY